VTVSIPHPPARRLVAAAAAALGLLIAGPVAPASAQEGLDQACRDAQVVPGSCVGITKLTERAAAECRRIGAPEESCVVPMSRRVLRKDVDKYERSWLHRTLAFQYRLGHELPLTEALWVGTHNSFNSTAETPSLSNTDSNQQLSLTDQLRIDVRSLELDVHWLPSAHAGGQPAPVVCHGRGANELHAGCTTEEPLPETLAEINAWLRTHPREVLLLYVEDNVDAPEGYAPTARALSDGLRAAGGRSLIYKPPAGGACTDLPVALTREQVLAARAQVLLVSGCGQGSAWRGLVFDWGDTHTESGNGCDYDPNTYATKLVRVFEDSTWLSATVTGEGEGITADAAGRMVRCGVDLFGFDQLLPRDGRLAALAWSWATNEPSNPDACTVQSEDTRWSSQSCRPKRRAACRAADGTWTISKKVRGRDAARACGKLGATFAPPRSAVENDALRAAADRAGAGRVWLGV
jgi:hypothetical protein